LKGKPANWSDTDNDWVAFKGNEKLEQELASIKKTESEILERLDKPIVTQVAGSIVGLFKSDSIEVDANSVVNSITITKMKKKYVFASVRVGQSHSFLVDVDWRTSATGSQGYSVGAEELANAENSLTSKSETHKLVKSNISRFRLENQSDEPQRYLS